VFPYGLVIAKKIRETMKYRFDSAGDSPHFDDERTVLSARRVVPLEKIDAKVRHRRRWFLGGAFAIAMLLGAASALVASYVKTRNIQNLSAPTEVAIQVDEAAAPVAVTESSPVAVEEPSEETDDTVLIPEESAPKRAPVKKRTVVIAATKPDDYMSDQSDSRRMSEDDSLHQIRDAVLFDEWQERRARRVLRRERRRAERNHRDLSNLDEIFEGRRRPNP
jgi:hypothetical protein